MRFYWPKPEATDQDSFRPIREAEGINPRFIRERDSRLTAVRWNRSFVNEPNRRRPDLAGDPLLANCRN